MSITLDDISRHRTRGGQPLPGVAVIFCEDRPTLQVHPLTSGGLRIGREVGDLVFNDALLSRAHAEIIHTGYKWIVRDLGSRNGTFVNGAELAATDGKPSSMVMRGVPAPGVVRVGRTILLLCDDIRSLQDRHVEIVDDMVIGPQLREAYDEIDDVATAGESLHITGPSGAGKELAARRYHNGSPRRSGPFVAVNCAAIPDGLAERLLFGAVKGAYSGADLTTEGYVQAAHGGTLFLDEIAELDLLVQAKLLRALETRSVVPLGATKPVPVDVLVCSATHCDLRQAVADGDFRTDLYFRVAQPAVSLPALSDRREEIPYLIAYQLAKVDSNIVAHPLFVEACVTRQWPGNIRELCREVTRAARRTLRAGKQTVVAEHISQTIGTVFEAKARPRKGSATGGDTPLRDEILAILQREEWNVSAAARVFGVHRNQMRRWMDRYEIDRDVGDQQTDLSR